MIIINCTDCIHIKTCKHYEYMCRYPELIVMGCTLKELKATETTQPLMPVGYSVSTTNNVVPLKAVKPEPEEPEYIPPELKECSNCGAKTYGEIRKCHHCGKEICDSCAFYGDSDLSTKDGAITITEFFCGDCYEELFHNSEEVELEIKESNKTLLDLIKPEEIELSLDDEGDDPDSSR